MLEEKRVRAFSREEREARRIFLSSFPKEERMPLFFFYGKDKDFFVYLDNEKVVGFSLVVSSPSFSLLYYLAVDSSIRGKGYGSEIVEKLREHYKGKLAVIYESTKKDSTNEEKIRRHRFYQSLGFKDTSYTIRDYSGAFDTASLFYPFPTDKEVIALMKKVFPFGICSLDN